MCSDCKKRVKKNYPFGKNSRVRETGHAVNCKKGER